MSVINHRKTLFVLPGAGMSASQGRNGLLISGITVYLYIICFQKYIENNMKISILLLLLGITLACKSQELSVLSPDKSISFNIFNNSSLKYSVIFREREIIGQSLMGFEFKDEPSMNGNFEVTGQKLLQLMKNGNR